MMHSERVAEDTWENRKKPLRQQYILRRNIRLTKIYFFLGEIEMTNDWTKRNKNEIEWARKIHLKKNPFLIYLEHLLMGDIFSWTIRSTSNNRTVAVAVDVQCHLFRGQTEWGRNVFSSSIYVFIYYLIFH